MIAQLLIVTSESIAQHMIFIGKSILQHMILTGKSIAQRLILKGDFIARRLILTGGGSASATQGRTTFSRGSKMISFCSGCDVISGGLDRQSASGKSTTNAAEMREKKRGNGLT